MSETDLVQSILIRFGSRPDMRLWRANVLVARDQSGRVVKSGVKGQADISGILQGGRRIEIECKTATGRQTPEQIAWQRMIERFGGLYILARSVDDVERALSSV